MSRVSDYAFGMRSSVRSDRTRCTNDTVHAVVSNYRPVRRNFMIPVLQRCLTHAYWEGTVVNIVDRSSQGSITALDAIISTSYMTSDGLRFRRRHRLKCHSVPALRRRSHLGLNWPSQARWFEASFCMPASHARRKLYPPRGPSGGHGFTFEIPWPWRPPPWLAGWSQRGKIVKVSPGPDRCDPGTR